MSIWTISLEHLASIHSEKVESFDYHGDHNGKCPHCGAFFELPHNDIINELLAVYDDGKVRCFYCGERFEPKPYGIEDYFSDEAPICDYIVDNVEGLFIGALIHHTNPGTDNPHVWTDTSKCRTYCEYRGEVVSVETKCKSLHRFCWNDYEDMRNGTRTVSIQ